MGSGSRLAISWRSFAVGGPKPSSTSNAAGGSMPSALAVAPVELIGGGLAKERQQEIGSRVRFRSIRSQVLDRGIDCRINLAHAIARIFAVNRPQQIKRALSSWPLLDGRKILPGHRPHPRA